MSKSFGNGLKDEPECHIGLSLKKMHHDAFSLTQANEAFSVCTLNAEFLRILDNRSSFGTSSLHQLKAEFNDSCESSMRTRADRG